MQDSTTYTAAVVGGGVGGRLSLDALTASPHFALRAVADFRSAVRTALEERYPGVQTFATHQEMFAACPTDIVCVSTYPPSHEEVACDALATLPDLRGILVEKPLGHTAASGRRILEAIQAKRLPMAVPHNLVALPTPVEIIERVHRGDIGALKLVEIQCTKWDIINAGIHWLHFFVSVTSNEPITHVLAQADKTTRTYRDGMQVETIAATSVQTVSGIRCIMHTGDDVQVNVPGKDFVFRLIGTGGIIEFYGWEQGYRIGSEWVTPTPFPTTGHRRHLEAMAARIDSGAADYTIPANSLAALEIVEAAYLSARHNCRVTFPLADFTAPTPNDWMPGEPYTGSGGGRDGRNL